MDITYIILGVIVLIFGLTGKFLAPFIAIKTTVAQREAIKAIVKILVQSAEQVFPSTAGPDKLTYVTELAEKYLATKKLKIDAEELRAMIESQVLELHSKIENYSESDTEKGKTED